MLLPRLFPSANRDSSRTFQRARRRRPGNRHKALRIEPLEDRRLLAVYTSADVPQSIPDQGTVTSTLEVTGTETIGDINVTLDISHTRDKDLDVYLIGPDQTRIELMTDVGGNGNDFQGTVLDDEAGTSITLGSAPFAGSFQPEGSLSSLDGASALGTWTLEITDDQKRETGMLNSWSIDISPGQPPLPTISIDDVQLAEGDSGTTAFVFTLTRSGDTSGTSSVDFATADGTANAGSDYVAAGGTVQFLADETSKTITVQVNGDSAIEPEETFFVNLSNPTDATVADGQGEGTILDDDAPPLPNDPLFAQQWQLDNTGQTGGTYDADMDIREAWSVTTGSMSTVVAVNDSGVEYTHEDLYLNIWLNEAEIPAALASTLVDTDGDGLITFRDLNDSANAALVSDLNATGYIDAGDILADPAWEDGIDTDANGFVDDLVGWDFFDGDNDPMDENGHGTAQAGRIGAMADNGVGMTGINWDVRLMPVRLKLDNPTWTIESAVGAIDYNVLMDVPISNNSWGLSGEAAEEFSQELYDAIDRARIAGHLFVTVVGGPGDIDLDVDPRGWALYDLDNILLENATDQNDLLYGQEWGAQSVDVSVSTQSSMGTGLGNQYGAGSGASAASAMLTGVAGLVHSVHPEWNYDQIKAQIMSTVDVIPGLVGKTVTGGRINAAAAVADTSIHISDPKMLEGHSGSSQMVFTVSRRGDTTAPLTLDWSTADGTASAGSDYVAGAGQLVFSDPLVNELTVSVTVNGDVAQETDETFLVNVSLASGSALLADASAQGTIHNDDRQITINDVTVTEGDDSPHFMGAFVQADSGGLLEPDSMIYGPDDNLYVTSTTGATRHSVLRYDGTTGAFIDIFVSSKSGGLRNPQDLVFGPDGNLYVSSFNRDEVLRFDGTTGGFIDVFVTEGSGGLAGPDDLTFGADGNLYVAGSESHNVLRYDGTSGAWIDEFVAAGSGGLSFPLSLAFGPDDNLYVGAVATGGILRYDGTTGAFLDNFVPPGSGGIDWPHKIIFRDGLLYVASSVSADAVLRYDATTGAFVDEFVPSGANGLNEPRAMTFDPAGNLLVSNSPANKVLRYGNTPEAVFTVTISSPSTVPVTVDFATADGTATVGGDYSAVNGTVTFEPGITTRTIVVPTIDDVEEESSENFFVNLSGASGGVIQDSQGEATITDDDSLPAGTKFFVADDGANQTFEYDNAGGALAGDTWNLANSSPRGAVASADGSTVWVIDSGKSVFVYDGDGNVQGSWSAKGGLKTPTGIASDGTDIWIVDTNGDKVLRYSGAASRTSGNQGASSSFALTGSNPAGITTDGASVWVVDSGTDRVYLYDTSGNLQGDWALATGNSSPTGLTIDPSGASTSVWVVDDGSDAVYEYHRDTGAFLSSFALSAGNTNPQGIADPPPGLLPPENDSVGALALNDQNLVAATSSALRSVAIETARGQWTALLHPSSTLSADSDLRTARREVLPTNVESGTQPNRATDAADRVFVELTENDLLVDDLPTRRDTDATDRVLVDFAGADLLDDDLLSELVSALSSRQ